MFLTTDIDLKCILEDGTVKWLSAYNLGELYILLDKSLSLFTFLIFSFLNFLTGFSLCFLTSLRSFLNKDSAISSTVPSICGINLFV